MPWHNLLIAKIWELLGKGRELLKLKAAEERFFFKTGVIT